VASEAATQFLGGKECNLKEFSQSTAYTEVECLLEEGERGGSIFRMPNGRTLNCCVLAATCLGNDEQACDDCLFQHP
jgi:hypothetical protein